MGDHPGLRLAGIARDVLSRFGADIDQARRPTHNASNEVWITDEVVLRLSRGADGSLRREALLAGILPAEVGYPAVGGHGMSGGLEWVVTERLPGANLGEAWSGLELDARTRAVEDLWTRLRAVHRTNVVGARALGCVASPFYALDENEAAELLTWLTTEGAVDPGLGRQVGTVLDELFGALRGVPSALAHTDAGPHNTVWSGTCAVPVDFEFACVASADLDLEHLLRTLSWQEGPDLTGHLVDQAADLLAEPGARHRLQGYAVLRDLWGVRCWLGAARAGWDFDTWNADAEDLDTWAPMLHLRAHVNGTSWLAKVL